MPIIVPTGMTNSSSTAPIIIKILPQFLPVRKAMAKNSGSNEMANNRMTIPGANSEMKVATNRVIKKSTIAKIIWTMPIIVTPVGL